MQRPGQVLQVGMSDLLDLPVTTLQGTQTTFGELAGGRVALVVNVASRCGNTPQYAKLEELQQTLADRGFTVLGFPCNQFKGQEPGTAADIAEFCSATYGVTFPMSDKIEVNGDHRDPIYAVLTQTPYAQTPTCLRRMPMPTQPMSTGTSRSSSSPQTARSWAGSPRRPSQMIQRCSHASIPHFLREIR